MDFFCMLLDVQQHPIGHQQPCLSVVTIKNVSKTSLSVPWVQNHPWWRATAINCNAHHDHTGCGIGKGLLTQQEEVCQTDQTTDCPLCGNFFPSFPTYIQYCPPSILERLALGAGRLGSLNQVKWPNSVYLSLTWYVLSFGVF